ncbi:MAG: hypothetical protein ABIP39_09165, partial [Polyangiaceae bacterium]
GQTLEQYCADRGSAVPCAPTWTEASAECALITSLYACADKNVFLQGKASAYYDARSGALVAIGGDGVCVAGPADFTFPVCPEGSYIECPRCSEPCGCVRLAPTRVAVPATSRASRPRGSLRPRFTRQPARTPKPLRSSIA